MNVFKGEIINAIDENDKRRMFLGYNKMNGGITEQGELWEAALKIALDKFIKDNPLSMPELMQLYSDIDGFHPDVLRLIKDKFDIYDIYVEFCETLTVNERLLNNDYVDYPINLKELFRQYFVNHYNEADTDLAEHALTFLNTENLKEIYNNRILKKFLLEEYITGNAKKIIIIKDIINGNERIISNCINAYYDYLQNNYGDQMLDSFERHAIRKMVADFAFEQEAKMKFTEAVR